MEAQKTQRQRVLTIDDSNWFGFPLYSNLRTLKLNNFIYFKVVLIISIKKIYIRVTYIFTCIIELDLICIYINAEKKFIIYKKKNFNRQI